jgi:unsaturated rhamnogalacturonyl hydrolase
MKTISRLVVICVALQLSLNSQAQPLPLSEQMATTVMQIWKDSFSLEGRPAKWTYDMGVILKGVEGIWLKTGDVRYFNYIQKQIDALVQADGTIKTYKFEDYNLDNINSGKLLLMLYRVTQKEKYLKAANILHAQIAVQPRTSDGGFWHKKIYPHQMWLDGLYMAEPFSAEYALMAKDDSAFNDIAKQFIIMESHARDAATGLLYHGWDDSKQQQWANKQTGCSPYFWSRAMGWYADALVDVLDYFPQTHPKRKDLINILNRLVIALAREQDPVTGIWKDILHYNGPGKEKNYFEASAASQFVYAIAKGVRNGYLSADKIIIAKKGYAGLVKQFVKVENGQTNLHGTVKVSGLGGVPYRDGSFNYYMSEPVIVNDPKGMGAFILASNEMEMLPTLSNGKGKLVLMDNYFNRETRQDGFGNSSIFHYKWDDRDNGGFSMLSDIFKANGIKTAMLDQAPTAANLKNAAVFFLVDPDWPKENKSPNYIEKEHVTALYNFVKAGGVLILMGNDSNNVEFTHFNALANTFGIHFDENMRHDVIDNKYDQGSIPMPPNHVIFKSVKKVFIKQLCTLQVKPPAKSVYTENGEVFMAISKVGKGTVFAVGDPWLYNEYVDGRKIPAEYENFNAAKDLVQWILSVSN